MILQALTKLYDDLLKTGAIPLPGWSQIKVGFALCIDETGELTQIVPQIRTVERKNKTVTENRTMELPAAVKRTVGIKSNFLWDNAAYILGLDEKGKADRFNACRQLHKEIIGTPQGKEAKAILSFFEKWIPGEADVNPIVAEMKEELCKGSNLVFMVNGVFAHEVPELKEAWTRYYEQADGEMIQCLINGENDVLERVHPAIKGVRDAQSSGAALVSFNADAFCSFNREQGANAPIGKTAAFAYTSALNHLLAEKNDVQFIGDTTVVCWADGAKPQYRALSSASLFGQAPPAGMTEDELRATVKRLANGLACPEYDLSPDTVFFILGLAPSAARISVRFFYRNSFGALMKNVNDHYERLQIVGERSETLPLWALLRETVNPKASDKTPSPVLSGSVTRAVLEGTRYPAALLEAVTLRIRAERNINSAKAAIIKAYYLKNQNPKVPKEVLTVSLNESSTNVPYTLGRLFAVYEAAQERANPGISATIRDKYFNAAAATPAHIFPVLNNLYQHHLRKMDAGYRVFFEKQVGALTGNLEETLPNRLGLPEQGAFQLGYYHQKQKRFEKKENN